MLIPRIWSRILLAVCFLALFASITVYSGIPFEIQESVNTPNKINYTMTVEKMNNSTAISSKNKARKAIVTYLAQEDTPQTYKTSYLLSARLMIRTIKDELKKSNTSNVDIVVMVIKDTCMETREILKREGSIVREVDSLSLLPKKRKGTANKYRHQFGKLFLWSFVEYSEVLFLDADIFIRSNILPLFDEVDRDAFDVAAVIDYGANFPNEADQGFLTPNPGYINGGLIWLKPSIARFNHIVSKLDETETWKTHWDLFEQDYLNWYFGKSIQLLDAKWNRQLLWWEDTNHRWLSKQPKKIYETTVCWHAKLWTSDYPFISKEWKQKVKQHGL